MLAQRIPEEWWKWGVNANPREGFLASKAGKISLGKSKKLILDTRYPLTDATLPPVIFYFVSPSSAIKGFSYQRHVDYDLTLTGPSSSSDSSSNWSLSRGEKTFDDERTGNLPYSSCINALSLDSDRVDTKNTTASDGFRVHNMDIDTAWGLVDDIKYIAERESSSSTERSKDLFDADSFSEAHYDGASGSSSSYQCNNYVSRVVDGTLEFEGDYSFREGSVKAMGSLAEEVQYRSVIFGVMGKNGARIRLLLNGNLSVDSDKAGSFGAKVSLYAVKKEYANTEFMTYDETDEALALKLPAGNWEFVSDLREFSTYEIEEGSATVENLAIEVDANRVYAIRISVENATGVSEQAEVDKEDIHGTDKRLYLGNIEVWKRDRLDAGVRFDFSLTSFGV